MKKAEKYDQTHFLKMVKNVLKLLKNITNKVGMMITIINVIVIITLLDAITDQKPILEKNCRVSDNFQFKREKQCVVKWIKCKRWPSICVFVLLYMCIYTCVSVFVYLYLWTWVCVCTYLCILSQTIFSSNGRNNALWSEMGKCAKDDLGQSWKYLGSLSCYESKPKNLFCESRNRS